MHYGSARDNAVSTARTTPPANFLAHSRRLPRAQMAELVDAPASGAGARKGVEVRVLFWAPVNHFIVLFLHDKVEFLKI
jgi:hypothetical protein